MHVHTLYISTHAYTCTLAHHTQTHTDTHTQTQAHTCMHINTHIPHVEKQLIETLQDRVHANGSETPQHTTQSTHACYDVLTPLYITLSTCANSD